MTKFIIGGQGPNHSGLGTIQGVGIFRKAKVVFETDDKEQIRILRNTTSVTEVIEVAEKPIISEPEITSLVITGNIELTDKPITPAPSIEVKVEKPRPRVSKKKKGVK